MHRASWSEEVEAGKDENRSRGEKRDFGMESPSRVEMSVNVRTGPYQKPVYVSRSLYSVGVR